MFLLALGTNEDLLFGSDCNSPRRSPLDGIGLGLAASITGHGLIIAHSTTTAQAVPVGVELGGDQGVGTEDRLQLRIKTVAGIDRVLAAKTEDGRLRSPI